MADLDDGLTRRVEAQARVADGLVGLERHVGHRLLAGAALTGVSARRWARVEELLARLWADLAAHRDLVAAARGRRPDELRRVLAELDGVGARLDAAHGEVVAVLDAAEAVHLAALAGFGPLVERLRAAREGTQGLLAAADPDRAVLAGLVAAVDERLAACARDPLAHAGRGPAELAGDLDAALAAVEARLAALAAVRDEWPQHRVDAAAAVAALDRRRAEEERARRRAHHLVDTDLPAPADPCPALRGRLAALPDARPGPAALAELRALTADTAAAAAGLRAATERAAGLTDRRGELRGRFAAYRAKAVRLGVAEDPAVVARADAVRALLDEGRVDLRAVTPALVAYQEQVREAGRR